MVLPIKSKGAKGVTLAGLLVAVGLVLHYAESLLPVFQILPGGKLGLANLVTLLAFSWYGFSFALLVGMMRCALSALFSGALTMFLYGGCGTILSVMLMQLSLKLFPKQVSTVGRSLLGAFAFNVGQVAVCALVLENLYVFSYLPVLMLIGSISGLVTGLIAMRTEAVLGFQKRN